jgi:hypothetical protein
VPLDLSSPTYQVTVRPSDGEPIAVLANRQVIPGEPAFLVSHFSTCPQADEFSRSKSERKKAIDALTDAAGAIARRSTRGEQIDLDARSPDKLIADLIAAYVAVTLS